jgi:hypothetical protein
MQGNDEWQSVMVAFRSWKKLADAERDARRAGNHLLAERLNAISKKAWRRYVRRWQQANISSLKE